MEVCDQGIDHFEMIARIDKDFCPSASGFQNSIFSCCRFQCSAACGSYCYYTFTCLLCVIDQLCLILLYYVEFGKNQVIITSLAILIAVAGYLNFADVDLGFRDKEASTDSSSILEDAGYDLTDETALLDENQADGGLTDNSLTDSQETDTPGEAVFTGSTGFAAQAKISREQVRSQNKADLQDIINNEEIDDEEKQEAIHTMVSMTDLSEKEAAAELLLEAKGFKNVVVNLTGETADVVIPEAELSDAQRAQIEDIVKRKTGIAPENIVITPLKESEDAEDTTQTDETSADTSYEEDSETSAQPYEDTAIDTTDIYD